jgi:Trypsin-co-occurring domain 2
MTNQTNLILLGVAAALIVIVVARQWRMTSDREKDLGRISVSQFVGELQQDLEKMERKRVQENRAAAFAIDSFDLELNFVIKSREDTAVEGGYDRIISIKRDSTADSEQVQKIVLHLKPRSAIEGEVPPGKESGR